MKNSDKEKSSKWMSALSAIIEKIAYYVALIASMVLSSIDEHYGITDRVITGLDDIGESIEDRVEQAKQSLYQNAAELADSIFDYAIDSAKTILINTAKHTLDKFLSGRPRLQ